MTNPGLKPSLIEFTYDDYSLENNHTLIVFTPRSKAAQSDTHFTVIKLGKIKTTRLLIFHQKKMTRTSHTSRCHLFLLKSNKSCYLVFFYALKGWSGGRRDFFPWLTVANDTSGLDFFLYREWKSVIFKLLRNKLNFGLNNGIRIPVIHYEGYYNGINNA